MPEIGWQLAITLLIVATAAVVVLRRAAALFRGKSAGGSCSGCSGADAGAANLRVKPLVSLEMPTRTSAEGGVRNAE